VFQNTPFQKVDIMKNEKPAKRKWWQRKAADKTDDDVNATATESDAAVGNAEQLQREKELLAHRVSVDVALKSVGKNIIVVIQVLRENLHLDLARAKSLADSAPTVIAEHMLTDEAATLANALRAAGATVELL